MIIGNGSDEIIALLTRALLLPGDGAIMADPSFSIYHLTTLSCHGTPVFIPLTSPLTLSLSRGERGQNAIGKGAGRHDLTQMAHAVTEKTRLIFICNPNNPTGTIVRQVEVMRFLSQLPKQTLEKRQLWIVFDEAYAEYVTDPAYPSSNSLLKKGCPVIFLRTFSKIYGLAGLRIGYGIGPADLIDILNRIRQPFNVNSLAQKAALAALSDEVHVKKSVELNESGKRYLYQQFDAMGISYLPTEANFICFNIKGAKRVYDLLLHQGVIIRHMGEETLRVSIGNKSKNQRFIRSFRKITEGRG